MRLVPRLVLAIPMLLLPATLEGQKSCRKGKPCGNTCIAQSRSCYVGDGGAVPHAPRPVVSSPASRVDSPPTRGDAPQALATRGIYAVRGEQTSGAWIASRVGRTYYRNDPSCRAGQQLAGRNRIYFESERAAQAAGYSRSRSKGC